MRARPWGTRVAAGGTACHRRLDCCTRHTLGSAAICLHRRGSCHVARKGTPTAVTCPAERALARSDSAAPRLSCLSTLGIAQRAWQPSCTCCRYLSSTWHVSSSPLTHPVLSLRVSRAAAGRLHHRRAERARCARRTRLRPPPPPSRLSIDWSTPTRSHSAISRCQINSRVFGTLGIPISIDMPM